MNKSNYTLYSDKKFSIIRFSKGPLEINDLLSINYKYKNEPEFSKILYMIVDISKCTPEFNKDLLNKLVESFTIFPQKNNHIKRIFIINAPLLTAFTRLFADSIPGESVFCSTIEGAYLQLSVNISLESFKQLF